MRPVPCRQVLVHLVTVSHPQDNYHSLYPGSMLMGVPTQRAVNQPQPGLCRASCSPTRSTYRCVSLTHTEFLANVNLFTTCKQRNV